MQQGTLGPLLVGAAPAAFGPHGRRRPEHLNVASIPGVEERGAVDAAGHGEFVVNLEAQARSVELPRPSV